MMGMLRWVVLMVDLVVATVMVLFADSIGDMAYVIATIVVIGGLAFFAAWPRLFTRLSQNE